MATVDLIGLANHGQRISEEEFDRRLWEQYADKLPPAFRDCVDQVVRGNFSSDCRDLCVNRCWTRGPGVPIDDSCPDPKQNPKCSPWGALLIVCPDIPQLV